ncbi:MAG: thermonuclease family protein [Candidatus Pacebacteria bacterium]|nr:thermonuclease family protein [Candidatus Paceibacterota bacterium]
MRVYRFILIIILVLINFFYLVNLAQALPVGTLLYRTSSNGKLYGLNEDELIHIKKGTIKNIYSGHVAIYVGEENGEHYIVEALAGGLQKTLAKHFIDSSQGEEFLGAKIPKQATWLQRQKIAETAKALTEFSLAYDFDFHHQKGPLSGQWTCVGLAEKLYESADIVNPYDISALVYEPQDYSVNITADGYDSYSRYNVRGDCFSRSKEFSLINPYTKMIMPLPEVFGFNVGKQYQGNRYIFLPYTQYLQASLEDVEVDIDISSDFIEEGIRPNYPSLAIALKWSFINQPLSAIKKVGDYLTRQKEILELEEGDEFNSSFTGEEKDDLEALVKVLSTEKESEFNLNNSEEASVVSDHEVNKKTVSDDFKKLYVYEVLSGDTIILNSGDKIRYIGVEAPELKSEGASQDECLAWVATKRNQELLQGKEIVLKKDANLDIDNYGSLWRYVYIRENNGELKLISEILAKEGLVEALGCENKDFCPQNQLLIAKVSTASLSAKDNKLGIYSDKCLSKEKEEISTAKNLWQKLKDLVFKNETSSSEVKIAKDNNTDKSQEFKDIFVSSPKADDKTEEENNNQVINEDVGSEDNSSDNSENSSNNSNSSSSSGSGNSNNNSSSGSSSSSSSSNSSSSSSNNSSSGSSGSNSQDQEETEETNPCLDSLVISRIFSVGTDDWLELFNPCDREVDLALKQIRLEKSKSLEDPEILLRFDSSEDYQLLSSSTKILPFSKFKIVRDEASDNLKAQADVLALKDSFTWSSSGYSFYLAKGPVSSSVDEDIIDLVGFGVDSLYFEGVAPAVEIVENSVLSRKASASSTLESMQTGEHLGLPFAYDSNDNSFDFLLWPLEENNTSSGSGENSSSEDKLLNLWHFNNCRANTSFDSLSNLESSSFDWYWVKGENGCGLEASYREEPLILPLSENFLASNHSLSWQQRIKADARLVLSLQNANDNNFVLTFSHNYIESQAPNEEKIRHGEAKAGVDENWHQIFFSLSLDPPNFKIFQDQQLLVDQELGQRLESFDAISVRVENGDCALDQLAIFSPSLSETEKLSLNYPLEPINLPAKPALTLKHYWSFDEGQGSLASDSASGYNFELDPSLWANGYSVFGLELDKRHEEVSVSLPALNGESAGIGFWYKNISDNDSGRAYLALEGNSEDVLGLRISAYMTELVFNGQAYRLGTSVLPYDNDWHYLAIIYNGYDYSLKLMLDGQEVLSRDFPWLAFYPDKLKIRRENFYFIVDELKIWQGDIQVEDLL